MSISRENNLRGGTSLEIDLLDLLGRSFLGGECLRGAGMLGQRSHRYLWFP
jgi:hypothetical protein